MSEHTRAKLTPHSQRSLFKIETLVKKLSSVVTKLPLPDSPATIRAIYAFGGVLRDKERLHDIDVVCLYSQTPEQSQRWTKFRESFNNLSVVSSQGCKKSPIRELWHLLEPYYEQGVPLAQAVKFKELSDALVVRGVEPQWAGCFSWTDIVNNPYGFFYPSLEKVLQRLLVKGVRGLTLIFVPYNDFMQGKSGYSRLNSILAWSSEKSDIEANLFGRTPEEKKGFMLEELQNFLDVISESRARYAGIKNELMQTPLKLNFEALEQRHTEISYDPQETYAELATKCEQARNEMRRYDEEIEVLTTLKLAFSRLTMPQEVPHLENPIEEQVAWFTLALQPKYLVKEERIRELLKILGLPEERVRAIKRPGSKTDYDLVKM